MKKRVKIERRDLIIGKEYYFDNISEDYGKFISENKDEDYVRFEPIINKTGFLISNNGFIEFYFEGFPFYSKHND